jgi:hypothetical protein
MLSTYATAFRIVIPKRSAGDLRFFQFSHTLLKPRYFQSSVEIGAPHPGSRRLTSAIDLPFQCRVKLSSEQRLALRMRSTYSAPDR